MSGAFDTETTGVDACAYNADDLSSVFPSDGQLLDSGKNAARKVFQDFAIPRSTSSYPALDLGFLYPAASFSKPEYNTIYNDVVLAGAEDFYNEQINVVFDRNFIKKCYEEAEPDACSVFPDTTPTSTYDYVDSRTFKTKLGLKFNMVWRITYRIINGAKLEIDVKTKIRLKITNAEQEDSAFKFNIELPTKEDYYEAIDLAMRNSVGSVTADIEACYSRECGLDTKVRHQWSVSSSCIASSSSKRLAHGFSKPLLPSLGWS